MKGLGNLNIYIIRVINRYARQLKGSMVKMKTLSHHNLMSQFARKNSFLDVFLGKEHSSLFLNCCSTNLAWDWGGSTSHFNNYLHLHLHP